MQGVLFTQQINYHLPLRISSLYKLAAQLKSHFSIFLRVSSTPSLAMASRISNGASESHKPIDLTTLKELPESHAWQGFDNFPTTDSTTTENMPIVDLADPKAMELIGHACKTWGAFQLTNHGIPRKLLEDVQEASRDLFALPMEQKLKVSDQPANGGFAGYGQSQTASSNAKKMWSETFTVFGSPLHHFRQLWPQDYSKYWYIYEFVDNVVKMLCFS